MSNGSCTFRVWMPLSVCDLNAPPSPQTTFTDSQTHNSVPKVIYIEQPGRNDKCVITLQDANQDFISLSSIHSRALLPRTFLAQTLPILCQRRASDKRGFITAGEWGTSDTQSLSRRRWSLWPLTPLRGQTDSVIWRQGHSIPHLLITVPAF